MTGFGRIAPGGAPPSEDAQSSATAGVPLEWQRELDVAIADIETRMSHPRRRATDVQPKLPQLGQPEITAEMIDEIAWRVSTLLGGDGTRMTRGEAVATAISQTVGAAPPGAARASLPPSPAPDEETRLPRGIALTLRIRRPLFRWPFRRRKQALITFANYRIT